MEKPALDILLLNPYFTYVKGSIYREVSNLDPPLGLVSLSAYLLEKGMKAMVMDLNVEIGGNEDLGLLVQRIQQNYVFKKPVFGISFLTPYVKSSYELADALRSAFPDALILAGGSHATFMAEEVLQQGNVDIVVRGEGELSLYDILAGIPLKEISGISYKEASGAEITIVNNPDRERIGDLDALPMPAYHQLKLGKYKPILGSYRKLPAANIITTRGCNGKCNFCCKTFGQRVTFRSPDNIVKEIEYLKSTYKVKHINIYDDTFTLRRNRVMEFCDLLMQRNLSIEWTCFARIDNMDIELLRKMRAAGCYQIMYGAENFNQEILNRIGKQIEVPKMLEVIRQTHEAGIITRISLMIGHPDDTWETFRNNLKVLKQIKPDIIVSSIFTPIPGSELYHWALANDRLLSHDWSRFAGNNSVLKLNHLSSEEVVKQYHQIYSAFYYNLPYLFRRLRRISNPTQFWMSVKAFFYILKFLVRK